MPLQTVYRPKLFKKVLGNKETVKALQALLKAEEHNHCILLTGDSGCGKTTMARIVAQKLGVLDPNSQSNPNFREFNASDFKGIDMVRSVRQDSSKVPLGGGNRVYFFDECHKLTGDAQEAFLKLLEEASGPNYYIFATTNPESLKVTFKRRCAQFALSPVGEDELSGWLMEICRKEGIKATDDVIAQIVMDATGSPGVALGILDAVKGLSGDEMMAAAKKQAALQNQVIELCRALAKRAKWKDIASILRGLQSSGTDAESIRRAVVGYCSSWLLKQDNPQAFVILDCFEKPTYDMGFPRIVHSAYMCVHSED